MSKKTAADEAEMAQLLEDNRRLLEQVAQIDGRNAMYFFALSMVFPPEKAEEIRQTFEADARGDGSSSTNA